MWRPAASSRVWSRIDAPETALDAVAQPCQGSWPLQSTRENSLLRESYTNPRCHAEDPRILPCTVSEPALHLNCRQPSQSARTFNSPLPARALPPRASAGPCGPASLGQLPDPRGASRGNLLENAQRGDRTLKIADQDLRELDPHLERSGGVIPAVIAHQPDRVGLGASGVQGFDQLVEVGLRRPEEAPPPDSFPIGSAAGEPRLRGRPPPTKDFRVYATRR